MADRVLRLLYNNIVYMGPSNEDDDVLLERLYERPYESGIITADVETVSTVNLITLGIGVSISGDEAYYCPTVPVECEELPFFMSLLSDSRLTKIYHNANFDIGALRKLAFDEELPWPDVTNVEDTALMAHVSGHKVGLETVAEEYLEREDMFAISDLLNDARTRMGKKKVNMLDVPWLETARKCLNDVLNTWQAYEYFQPLAIALPQVWDCYTTDIELWSNLKQMETIGLGLDKEEVDRQFVRLSTQVRELKEKYEFEYGFNIGSTQQVGFMLASRGHILPLNKSRKALRSGKEFLVKIDDELARDALEYRSLSKLLSTYIVPWRSRDRAYTHFRLDLSTGRLGSFDRNLQNVPPEMRLVFKPDTGVYTWADMSQIEMRAFAYITKEPRMLAKYANGEDIHQDTTEKVIMPYVPGLDYNGARKLAKTFNFAMIYYGEAKTLSERCGLPLDVATRARLDWLNLYPTGRDWMDHMYSHRFPYVEDIYGRRMRIPTDAEVWEMADGNSWKFKSLMNHIRRTQVNFPVQASAASINKRGMNMLFEWQMPVRLQVHDEYLWDGAVDVPEELHHIHPELETPFEVKRGPRWVK